MKNFRAHSTRVIDEWYTSTFVTFLRTHGPVEERPSVLFVGFEHSLASFQKRKYEGRELSDIEGVSEYFGEKGRFLHVADVTEISSLETFRNFGIRDIWITPENISCTLQDVFYSATYLLIENFSEKRGNPFKTHHLLVKNDRVMMLLSLLTFVLSESKNGSITTIDLINKRFFSKRIASDISWRRWKLKADALFRVGELLASMDLYFYSFNSLTEQHLLSMRSNSVDQVFELKKEAAKILTNFSLMCLKVSPTDWREFRIEQLNSSCLEFDNLQPFQCQLMKSLFFAMEATEWNVCWSRSYDRMGAAVQKLKALYSQQLEEEKKAPKNTINARIRKLIDEDKLLSQSESLWDDSNVKWHPDFQTKKIDITVFVKNYKEGLQTATIERLICLRQQVSDTFEELQKRSDEVRKKMLNEHADQLDAIHTLRLEADIVLKSEILFGTYAVRWNPTNVKNYEALLASLERFETVVNQLKDETKKISEDQYLEEEARKEIIRAKTDSSSVNDS